jgi:NitT/TauT family transport system substrate-binding protein
MQTINIQFTLFSAFYSPLITTIASGLLQKEGLDPKWSVAAPGTTALDALKDGTAHVVQSALSQGFNANDNDDSPEIRHFAQVNEMDGFFLTARKRDADFDWKKLENSRVILFGGGQPLVMFKYACYKAGIDFNNIEVVNVGGAAAMDEAFRAGEGDYVQQQGPFPQQIEADGLGHIVARVGPKVGPCGFSSLAATKTWLQSDMARAFVRAYTGSRLYLNEKSASDIATMLHPYFTDIDLSVLKNCIESYQQLGCWTPHIEITDAAYNATLDIYQQSGGLETRYPYNDVCSLPPSA